MMCKYYWQTSLVLSTLIVTVFCDLAQEVKTSILKGYDRGIRPRCPPNDVTNVTIDVAVRQVLDLDERNQVIHLSLWIRLIVVFFPKIAIFRFKQIYLNFIKEQRWEDCRMTWNTTEFGGLSSLVLQFHDIWHPDLTLYDNIAGDFMETAFRPNVQFNGIVNYNFPLLVDVLCPIAVQRFPFDTQSCKLTIGSWTSHGGLIDVHPKHPHGDLSATKLNVEWEEVAFPAVRNVEYYACCPEPYPDVTFTLTLRRKPTYYVNHIIIPSVLITVISLLGFILPVESGEKVSLQVTILLSLAVFQLLVADSLPPDSASTPYISQFFTFGLFIVTLAILLTVAVLFVHHKGNVPVPKTLKTLCFRYLAVLTLVYVPKTISKPSKGNKGAQKYEVRNSQEKENGTSEVDTHTNGTLPGETLKENSTDRDVLVPNHEEEWKYVARILERICLIGIFLTGVIGTTLILVKMLTPE